MSFKEYVYDYLHKMGYISNIDKEKMYLYILNQSSLLSAYTNSYNEYRNSFKPRRYLNKSVSAV